MNYLTLDLDDGDLVLSDNSVWKSLNTWLDGGTLYSDYYDASNCGDFWNASVHWINIDSSSTNLTFTIEFEFINAIATDSCLCQIKFDEISDGVAVTVDATGLNILNATISKHVDCNYSNANIKIDITVNLLIKEITTYIHKDNIPLAKTISSANYSFTKFLIQAGSRGGEVYRLPTTTKLLNVSVSDDAISYNNFSETLNYVDKHSLAKIWANTKSYITSQLLGKSNTGHTHSKSDLTNLFDTANTWSGNNAFSSVNGVNPGALSLPDLDSNNRTVLDLTNWLLDGTVNNYTPTVSGWLNIRIADTVGDFVAAQSGSITISAAGTGVMSALNSPVAVLVPVVAGTECLIYIKASTAFIALYPCQGNVVTPTPS